MDGVHMVYVSHTQNFRWNLMPGKQTFSCLSKEMEYRFTSVVSCKPIAAKNYGQTIETAILGEGRKGGDDFGDFIQS